MRLHLKSEICLKIKEFIDFYTDYKPNFKVFQLV